MTTRAYIPNRDFDSFVAGVRVELDDRNPYVRTGYLDEVELVDLGDDEDDDDEPAAPVKATAPRAAPAKKAAAGANAGAPGA